MALTIIGDPNTEGSMGGPWSLGEGGGMDNMGSVEPDTNMELSGEDMMPSMWSRWSWSGAGEGGGRDRLSWEDSDPALLTALDLPVSLPD